MSGNPDLTAIPLRSFVLLDTNILIDSAKFPESFTPFYRTLEEREVQTVLESTIQFEFLRGFQVRKNAEEFLEAFLGKDRFTLVPDKDLFEMALRIAHVYYLADNKHIKIADALIAAQISKYARSASDANELLLATQNHKDFPPVLFQRLAVHLVTLPDGSIKTLGVYRFDLEVFKKFSSK